MTDSNPARGTLGRVNDRARPAQSPGPPGPSPYHLATPTRGAPLGQRARLGPPIGCGCREPRPRPGSAQPGCWPSIRTPGGPSSPQCGPSMTPRVTQVRPVPFPPRAVHTWPPRSRRWGRPREAWSTERKLGGGGDTVPRPRAPRVRGPQPGAPWARPRAGSRLPAAARRITPLAAARLVPGRSPDAHWPGRRSQAVSPCGVSARGRPRLNSAGAGLEGARETVAASPPPHTPSSLSLSRSHSRPRPDQVQAARPGRGRKLRVGNPVLGPDWIGGWGGSKAAGLERAPPARILWPWVRMVRRADGEGSSHTACPGLGVRASGLDVRAPRDARG